MKRTATAVFVVFAALVATACASPAGAPAGTVQLAWTFDGAGSCERAGVDTVLISADTADGASTLKRFDCDEGSGALVLPAGPAALVVGAVDGQGRQRYGRELELDVPAGELPVATAALAPTLGGDVWVTVVVDPECTGLPITAVVVGIDDRAGPPLPVHGCAFEQHIVFGDVAAHEHLVQAVALDAAGGAVFYRATQTMVAPGSVSEVSIAIGGVGAAVVRRP